MVGETRFNDTAWGQALLKFGEVTGLTVVVYGRDGDVIRGPINVTPLFGLFQDTSYQPGIFVECARQCVAQIVDRPAIVVAPSSGLAVVGTSLVLAGEIVGAAVAGYAFIDFCTPSAVELLARRAGVPFDRVWSIARITPPVPERRLVVHGELLQVLGEAILRENERTHQYEEKSAELTAAAAAKDNFLAVVSHELRTPLTPILLRVQLLKGERDPGRIDASAAVIERNVRLQVRLVEDLLEFTRARRGTIRLALQNLDLGSEARVAVHSALEMAREREIMLRLVGAEEPLPVSADRDRLQQILQNIIGNAIKFTPAGGTITVTVAPSDRSGTVGIVDTGRGIAREFLPFVFDMFRREEDGGDPPRPGLGIGLALVRRLVELHGGDIRVSSAGTGQGTAVLVRLPLIRDTSIATLSDASAEIRSRTLAGVRVLVVEDADDVREALRLLLEALGAQVSDARDGLEGLEAVSSHQPDVVLCDMQMPRVNGFEFLSRLRAGPNRLQPPVIAITGTGSGSRRSRTAAAGFTSHLDKPVDERSLLFAIESALVQRSNP